MTKDVAVSSYTNAPAKPVVVKAALIEQVTQLVSSINDFREISTPTANEAAGLTLSHITKLEKQIDASRAAAKKPFLEMGRAVDSRAKEVLEPLRLAKGRLKELLLTYRKGVEARNVQADADENGVVVLEAEARTEHTKIIKGVDYEVTGKVAQIPHEYLMPDEKKIKAAVRAGILTSGNAPWLRIFETERVQAR